MVSVGSVRVGGGGGGGASVAAAAAAAAAAGAAAEECQAKPPATGNTAVAIQL